MADPGPYSLNGLCAIRVTRLLADGTPDFDQAKGSFMLCEGVQRFVYDFATQAGKVTTDEDACGTIIVNRKREDQVLRVTWTLTLLKSDYRFDDVTGAAEVLLDGGDIAGSIVNAAAGCVRTTKPRFCMELWSERIECSDLGDPPYRLNVMGSCKVNPKGHTKEDATAAITYEGVGEVNVNFGDGPWGTYPTLVGETNWVWADFDTDSIPTCPDPLDYIATPVAS